MNQVKEVCQTMHPRLRQYKHEVRNMFDNFFDVVNIIVVPREVNHRANNLSKSVVYLMPPNLDHFLYSIKVMHWIVIPDNIKWWKVFEDNAQIDRFLNMVDEYTNMNIDSYGEEEEGELDTDQSSNHDAPDIIEGKKLIQLKQI